MPSSGAFNSLALGLAFLVLMMKPSENEYTEQPRGVRNRNPLNIENNGILWDGMAAAQTDPRFVVFDSAAWGIRAAAKILHTYRNKYGLYSVAEMVNRWAPPFENPTDVYAGFVAAYAEVDKDQALTDAEFSDKLPRILQGMARFENGADYYTAAEFIQGVALV